MGGSSSNKPQRSDKSASSSDANLEVRLEDLEAIQARYSFLEQQIDKLERIHASIEEALQFEKNARNRLERELELAHRDLEEARAVQSQFFDNMSHELRTPLNGILGMTQLMLAMPLHSELRDYTETIERSGRTLDKIISSILEYSHLAQQDIRPTAQTFNLESLLEKAIADFAVEAFQKNVECYVLYQGNPGEVIGDASRILRILELLVANAVKFTDSGYICVEALLQHADADSSTPLPDSSLELRISDTGIGIDKSLHESIFEPFRQADGSMTRAFGGIGMGLALCKRLVEFLGGRISVHSAKGHGAVFKVTLPLQPVVGAPDEAFPLPKDLRLGILTHHENMFQVAEHILSHAGVKDLRWITPGHSGEDALRDLDLLLVDFPPGAPNENLTWPFAMPLPPKSAYPRIIALIPPGAKLAPSLGNHVEVIMPRPVFRRPLLEAIDFAALSIDRKDGDPDDISRNDATTEETKPVVLIVEPLRINQKIMARMIETLHYGCDIIDNLAPLPDMIAANAYHSILINPQVDPSDDFAYIKSALQQAGDGILPEIIAITGKTASYDVNTLRDAGISKLLVMPVKRDQLREALKA